MSAVVCAHIGFSPAHINIMMQNCQRSFGKKGTARAGRSMAAIYGDMTVVSVVRGMRVMSRMSLRWRGDHCGADIDMQPCGCLCSVMQLDGCMLTGMAWHG